MTPDEQHKKYFSENPQGNHESPSGETLRFMNKTDSRYNYLQETMLGIKDTLIEFKTKTDQGIKDMHSKQDHTNGWITEHEREHQEVKDKELADQKDKWMVLWKHSWKVGAGILLLVSSIGGFDNLKELITFIF